MLGINAFTPGDRYGGNTSAALGSMNNAYGEESNLRSSYPDLHLLRWGDRYLVRPGW